MPLKIIGWVKLAVEVAGLFSGWAAAASFLYWLWEKAPSWEAVCLELTKMRIFNLHENIYRMCMEMLGGKAKTVVIMILRGGEFVVDRLTPWS